MKKRILSVILVAVVVVAAIAGILWYRDYAERKADNEAAECLNEYFRLCGDGYPNDEAKAKIAETLVQMAEIATRCGKDMREDLMLRRIDGSFVIGKYEDSIALIDGLPGKSSQWKKMTTTKLRAHAAMAKNDNATAIKEFQSFCDILKADAIFTGEQDPQSGLIWTKSAILALNYRRMAGLAKDIGQTALEAELMKEAREYAAKSLKETDEADMLVLLKTQFADLLK